MIRQAPLAVGAAALAVAALSLLLPSTPAYDPWAWLIWGREIASLELDTTSGPAWKPLPVLVTSILAPLGDAAPAAWLVLARAAGVVAVVLAFVVAARLARGTRPLVAGAAAASALVLTVGFARGVAFGTSEGILVAAVLLAIERHLAGRRGVAFAAGVAAALVRPEVWPLLALYAAWLWQREPERRRALGAAAVAVPALWFLPELWGSGDLLRSSDRARVPNPGHPALAERPAAAALAGLVTMLPPIAFAAVAALARRRDATAAVAAGGLAWAAVVIAMSELGFSGEQRYLLGAAALLAVAGGVTAARLPLPLAALLVAAPLPFAVPAARELVRELDYSAELRSDLGVAVERAGGAEALRACGAPAAGRYRFPLVAWHLETPISALALDARTRAVVLRSRLRPGDAPAPPAPATHRRVASAGAWEVLARCT